MPALVETFSTTGRGWIVNEIISNEEKKRIGPNEIIGTDEGFTIDDGSGAKICAQNSQAAAAHFVLKSEYPYISREGERKTDIYVVAVQTRENLSKLLEMTSIRILVQPPTS